MSQTRKNVSIFSISVVLSFLLMYWSFSYTAFGSMGALLMASFMAGLTVLLGAITFAIQHHRNQEAFSIKQKSVDDRSTHQTRTVEIALPFDDAFDLALEALQTLNGEDIPKTMTGIRSKQTLKIHKTDRNIGRIEAGLRAKTLGIQDVMDFSRMQIQLQRLDNGMTRIQIESKPTNPLEMYDLGRHTHYVNAVAIYLRKESQPETTINNLSEQDDSIEDDFDAEIELRSKRLGDT